MPYLQWLEGGPDVDHVVAHVVHRVEQPQLGDARRDAL